MAWATPRPAISIRASASGTASVVRERSRPACASAASAMARAALRRPRAVRISASSEAPANGDQLSITPSVQALLPPKGVAGVFQSRRPNAFRRGR
jgi:hypothetical protein